MIRRGRAAVSLGAIGRVGVTLALFALQGCSCVSYSNHLWIGSEPPKIQYLQETDLRSQVNKELSCPARFLGFLTTPFKRVGVRGWRDMRIDVLAVGKVMQSAWSTDHFVTVDLELSQITAAGTLITLRQTRYLRAEICERQLGLPRAQWPCPGDHVRISGRLMWDGDGFLEVHPQKRIGLEILKKAPGECR